LVPQREQAVSIIQLTTLYQFTEVIMAVFLPLSNGEVKNAGSPPPPYGFMDFFLSLFLFSLTSFRLPGHRDRLSLFSQDQSHLYLIKSI